jgi:DNA-binding protein H-NS
VVGAREQTRNPSFLVLRKLRSRDRVGSQTALRRLIETKSERWIVGCRISAFANLTPKKLFDLLHPNRSRSLEGDKTMAKPNLSRLDFEELMHLRRQVEEMLGQQRRQLEKQLETIAAFSGERAARGGRGVSSLKGKKVPPKYRGPSGETWAGRGARPRWLVAAIKGGKKLDDFLIDKSARKTRKVRKRSGKA